MGLREIQNDVRDVMPEESTIDLDAHARLIALVVNGARTRAWGRQVRAEADSIKGYLVEHAGASDGSGTLRS